MFEIIVRLEEGIASKELDENTAYRKHVARIRPWQTWNQLRSLAPKRDSGTYLE